MPHAVILAGPNGAGKTTAAATLLPQLRLLEFVNAGTIARGLSAFNPESAAISAGRIMLTRLRELAAAKRDFAFETTLASKTFAPWLKTLRQDGYYVELIFCSLPSPDLSISRVAGRVRGGGHHVPADTIRRRYEAGLRNFFGLYIPIVNRWRIYDSSADLRPIAEGPSPVLIHDPQTWSRIEAEYGTSHPDTHVD